MHINKAYKIRILSDEDLSVRPKDYARDDMVYISASAVGKPSRVRLIKFPRSQIQEEI